MENFISDLKSNEEKFELYSDEYPFKLSLRIKNFADNSEYKKFIKTVERMVRMSLEYKEWRNYIIDVLGIDHCMLTNESVDEVTIEVHHHIPSLYALVSAVTNEFIEKEKDFCTMDVALKIIELHFQNKVGYVTLLKSMHEKFHNGYLRIPINLVKGDYQYILKHYKNYFDEDELDKINYRMAVKESNVSWTKETYSGEKEEKKETEDKKDVNEIENTVSDDLNDLINVA